MGAAGPRPRAREGQGSGRQGSPEEAALIAAPRLRPVAYLALFAFGAAIGTAWDQMHVRAGAEFYTSPSFAGQAWWVPLEFGLAYAAGVAALLVLGRPQPDERSAARLGIETLWLSGVYALTATLSDRPVALTALVAALLIVRAPAVAGAVLRNPMPAAILVLGGPAIEASLSALDLFGYTRAQLLGIPAWLPLLYVHAVPFAVRVAESAVWFFRAPALAET